MGWISAVTHKNKRIMLHLIRLIEMIIVEIFLRVNSMGAGNLIKATSLRIRREAQSGWTV